MTKKATTPAASATKPQATQLEPTPTPAPQPTTGRILTRELIDQLRAAGSVDDALKLLQPEGRANRVPENLTYQLGTTSEPLPQKRGISLTVLAVAARFDRPFSALDLMTSDTLKNTKSAKYWLGRLIKSGHIVPVEMAVTK